MQTNALEARKIIMETSFQTQYDQPVHLTESAVENSFGGKLLKIILKSKAAISNSITSCSLR